MSEWTRVDAGLPKEYEPVLVACGTSVSVACYTPNGRYNRKTREYEPGWRSLGRDVTPTHWMPFPAPPQEPQG